MGLALAVGFGSIILNQYLDRAFPGADKVYEDMILCGPFGQGSFALQVLGQAVQSGSFAAYDRGNIPTAKAADPIGFIGQFIGLLVWGLVRLGGTLLFSATSTICSRSPAAAKDRTQHICLVFNLSVGLLTD
jgi:hypothetical protein